MRIYRGPEGTGMGGPEAASGDPGGHARPWQINGFQAEIRVWSPEEWAKLDRPPSDAVEYPGGIRAALRMA